MAQPKWTKRLVDFARKITHRRVLVLCELSGFGLIATAVWIAFGAASGLAAAGIGLLIIGNSKS